LPRRRLAEQNALAQGMQVKAVEFQRNGGQFYVPLKAE
jgi:phosphomethylpyrimidine synthase